VLSFLSGNAELRAIWNCRDSGRGRMTIFCGAMSGASMGFLWYNAHPAEIFMGDVGSLALGGGWGGGRIAEAGDSAAVHRGVYVIECLSVILQVEASSCAQAHLQDGAGAPPFRGAWWQEEKIIARFWIAGWCWRCSH